MSYLDKWHSFLFHPNVKQKQHIIQENGDDDDEDEEEKKELDSDLVVNTNTMLGNHSNKFVTDATKYGGLSKAVSTKLNFNSKGDNLEDDEEIESETYYEYGFGEQIKYHEHDPHFLCMKDELIGNDIHTITEKVWDDTLTKALLCLEMESVIKNYKANDHSQQKQYGIKEGDLIGIDNVIAILFYCNFDHLQNKFSKTFRKIEVNDTEEDVIQRHCKNFYWLGRHIYIFILHLPYIYLHFFCD